MKQKVSKDDLIKDILFIFEEEDKLFSKVEVNKTKKLIEYLNTFTKKSQIKSIYFQIPQYELEDINLIYNSIKNIIHNEKSIKVGLTSSETIKELVNSMLEKDVKKDLSKYLVYSKYEENLREIYELPRPKSFFDKVKRNKLSK